MSSEQKKTTALTGLVLNIQHFCTHDGPRIRPTVFLKGCSLRCKWCSNPESIHLKPELAYNAGKCIGEKECGFCLKNICPESAIYVVGSGDRADDKVRINWDLCTNCGKCAAACPANSLYLFGKLMSVDVVLAEVGFCVVDCHASQGSARNDHSLFYFFRGIGIAKPMTAA